jgi:fructose 1,6-bisphosphatase
VSEEVLKRVEEVAEKAKTIGRLANDIYYTLKDVQKFVAENRKVESEPDWQLLDTLVLRAFRDAAEIARDMKDVKETIEKLARVLTYG